MKKMMLLSLAVAGVSALHATPTVSDVTVGFDSATRMMTIGYALSEKAVVTVDILTNGVSVGAAKFADVAGDVNGVVKAGRGTISWRPEHLWPERKFDAPIVTANVKAWALDAPPPYLVVWLNEEKGKVRYYDCEAALPGGIGHNVYRTKRLVMSRIPAKGATWRMGSPSTEVGRQASEVPHYVTFTNDYYMSVFPVTEGQGILVWGYKPGSNVYGKDGYPVVFCSYNLIRGTAPTIDWPTTGSAVASDSFLGKLRSKTSLAFDIPTEAQWEYAARAGSPTAYCNNLECLTSADAVDSNLAKIGWYRRGDYNRHEVGLKQANAWGLYDVCGTIWEWCRDWVGTGAVQAYAADEVTDPPGLTSGTWRSRRGGSFDNVPYAARCAFRTANTPDVVNVSFRLMLPVSEVVGK